MEDLRLANLKQIQYIEQAKNGNKDAFALLIEDIKVKLYKTRNCNIKK